MEVEVNQNVVAVSIGQSLSDRGLVSSDQLQIGILESQSSGKALERTLVDLGFITEDLLRDVKGEVAGAGSVELASALPDEAALAVVPEEFARRNTVVPLFCDEKSFRVAVCDLHDLQLIDRLERMLKSSQALQPVLASERDIVEALDRFYGFELSIDGILREIEQQHDQMPTQGLDDNYTHPFVRLVESILTDAVRCNASDIHFEPEAGFLRIRYRIDGLMRQVRSLHGNYWPAIAVRLKVLAELDIAESRAAQDGRMSFAIAGGQVEFRVSVLPTVHGENIVLRILDKARSIVALDALGMSAKSSHLLKRIMSRPEGLILVTGPTGSGKTTTLYSMLNAVSSETTNIMTMEDPVEYPLPLLRQTSVNEQVKLDFASGIRAILRQDPDIILVGEVRDVETAHMALRASMTGHQVYSTLHANSAVGALARLNMLGVRKEEIVGNLIGVVAQRLVRKLCEYCKTPATEDQTFGEINSYRASGCRLCDHQGYKGRTALMEVLVLSNELEGLYLSGCTPGALLAQAQQDGFLAIFEDAKAKVAQGITSVEEVARVVDLSGLSPESPGVHSV